MFLGTHTPRLDDKGRLFLPAKFRDQLGEGLVVTRGQERCLYVFPMAEFEQVTATMRNAPTTNRQVRDFMRVFLSGASDKPRQAGPGDHPRPPAPIRRPHP